MIIDIRNQCRTDYKLRSLLRSELTNVEIGKQLGISPEATRLWRIAAKQVRHPEPPPESELALLGKKPDRQLAKQWGIHPQTVANWRKKRGIPAYTGDRQGKTIPKEDLHLLGQFPDSVLAQTWGISISTVKKYRDRHQIRAKYTRIPKDELHLLGTMPDGVLAQRWGVSRVAVFYQRKKFNIPVFGRQNVDRL